MRMNSESCVVQADPATQPMEYLWTLARGREVRSVGPELTVIIAEAKDSNQVFDRVVKVEVVETSRRRSRTRERYYVLDSGLADLRINDYPPVVNLPTNTMDFTAWESPEEARQRAWEGAVRIALFVQHHVSSNEVTLARPLVGPTLSSRRVWQDLIVLSP